MQILTNELLIIYTNKNVNLRTIILQQESVYIKVLFVSLSSHFTKRNAIDAVIYYAIFPAPKTL